MTDERTGRLRVGLGALAVGVCVVTTLDGAEPHGATGMAWGEDPEPPLLLTTLRRTGTTRRLVASAGVFGINVLAVEHRHLARQFAMPGDRFRGLDVRRGAALGVPLLGTAIAAFECSVEEIYPFGAHDIVVGRIEACTVMPGEADPAVHVRGHLRATTDPQGGQA